MVCARYSAHTPLEWHHEYVLFHMCVPSGWESDRHMVNFVYLFWTSWMLATEFRIKICQYSVNVFPNWHTQQQNTKKKEKKLNEQRRSCSDAVELFKWLHNFSIRLFDVLSAIDIFRRIQIQAGTTKKKNNRMKTKNSMEKNQRSWLFPVSAINMKIVVKVISSHFNICFYSAVVTEEKERDGDRDRGAEKVKIPVQPWQNSLTEIMRR